MFAKVGKPTLLVAFATVVAVLGGAGAMSAGAETGVGLGCAITADAASGKVLFREGRCDQRVTPASSFKIPIALMAYDAGILTDAHEPQWDYRPGYPVNTECDKGRVDPTVWEKCSVVWYSQEITVRLGMDRFRAYVKAFDYGDQDLAGTPGKNNGLTHAWLASSLQISADEQIAFLRKFLSRSLPVSARAHELTTTIVPVFRTDGGWTVHGKTGGGRMRGADGLADPDRPLGWFVGWAEKGERQVVFARLVISGGAGEPANGVIARTALLAELDRMAGQP